jgi:nucleoside-diphosphate-sugar epimerase
VIRRVFGFLATGEPRHTSTGNLVAKGPPARGMDPKPLSVLVTGSSGFIGTNVVRHLHEAGHKVTALDQLPPKKPLPVGVMFEVCDIRQGLLPPKTFDVVVHLAAHAGVRSSIHDPLGYQFTNVIGTIRLLDHCRKMGTPHFVFASSSSVYGPDTPLPTSLVRFALDDQSSSCHTFQDHILPNRNGI